MDHICGTSRKPRFRSYYTKWHEIGHLLILLTDQMRLAPRRTHAAER
jgi:hypothetical protein